MKKTVIFVDDGIPGEIYSSSTYGWRGAKRVNIKYFLIGISKIWNIH